MSEAPAVSPELAQHVVRLSRALIAAARTRAMYPSEHPAVGAALSRLLDTISDSTSSDIEFSLGVTPDTLLIKGEPLPPSQPVTEAAEFLHERDILRLDFAPGIVIGALHDLLELLNLDPVARREGGGPAAIWARAGHPSVSIEQIDYLKILEDHDVDPDAVRRDDVWHSIVKSIVHGQMTFDEREQQRLLEIARDPTLIGELALEAIASKCAADGSPMVATQAATVVAAFRHLAGLVGVMEPERLSEVMKSLAEATLSLDPNVALKVLQTEEDVKDGVQVVRGMTAAFDDTKVAKLLAAVMAVEGGATDRLADVFHTIAPDAERRERVVRMAREMLGETDFGKSSQFKALWGSMEDLLLAYNEKPYVSEGYRTSLDAAGARADGMAARELPPELGDWVETLGQDNVRRLSVTMMIDLLRIEYEPARGETLAGDIELLAEDLLLASDFDNAVRVTTALAEASASRKSVAQTPCREALDTLARSDSLRETIGILGEVETEQYEMYRTICRNLGPEAVEVLSSTMFTETESLARRRAGDIIVEYGAAAVLRLAPLVADERWFVQLNGVVLLGRIADPTSVPLLQPLLRKADPRTTPRVVSALAGIDDPAAARAIHTVLRSATGELRHFVISALVQERDMRVVPILERILQESEPLGRDHAIVLETMNALATLAGDRAVPPIARLIRRKRWLARRKSRALKQTGVDLLLRVGTVAAGRALEDGRENGDRLLRRIIRRAQRAQPAQPAHGAAL